MSERVRVHILAKELGLPNKELVGLLCDAGHEVKSHLTAIDDEVAEQIRQQLQNGNGSAAAVETATPPSEPEPESEPAAAEPKSAKEKSTDSAKTKDSGKGSKNRRKERQDKSVKSRVFTAPEPEQTGEGRELHLKPPILVKGLAEAMDIKPADLIRELLTMNVFASINQTLDTALAQRVADKHGFKMITDKRQKSSADIAKDEEQPENAVFDDAEVESRPPVVAFLGHVDHGKTSLQDFIRKTNVTEGEAGGITQHIGATNIEWQGNKITMIDTPGHEAFTSMRARGANSTDIVVLVVAATDGFMPQTVEALNHARAAEVPIVVALNKIDLENANIDRVLSNMQQNDMLPEPWGGDYGVCNVSAMTGEGVDGLLERLVLEAEMLELKCNSKLPVRAFVLESQLEPNLGPTVNVLIKNGTIKVGDIVICSQYYGKVKALFDCRGTRIESAGPSMPVKVVGLSGVPDSGSVMAGCKNERQARRLTTERGEDARKEQLTSSRSTSIEDLFNEIEQENRKELKAILRSDVQGTCEAVIEALGKLQSDKIDVDLVLSGVGAITENDVILAAASNALIIGFHVRVNPGVNELAKREGVTIKLFSIIYELIEQIRSSLEGMLDPVVREEDLGRAQILQVFTMSKNAGKICGCTVSKGIVKVGAHARVHRQDELIYNGTISSLRHFTDDVKEVRQGFECGIKLDNFTDFDVDDVIEVYEYKESRATL